jgi:hypothetical protein
MSEWLKEHAWKLTPAARADAQQIPPTHFRCNDFRNIDVRRRVPVNHGVDPGFRGACDTVLTQRALQLPPTHINPYRHSHFDRIRRDEYNEFIGVLRRPWFFQRATLPSAVGFSRWLWLHEQSE